MFPLEYAVVRLVPDALRTVTRIMRMLLTLVLPFSLLVWAPSALGATITELVQQAMGGDHRAPANVVRDQYRHPAQTLRFLGLKPEMTVVEIWPSEGWYTEILAPATRPRGIFYAAGFAMTAERTPGWRREVHTGFTEKLERRPDVYDHVVVTELSVPERTTIAPAGHGRHRAHLSQCPQLDAGRLCPGDVPGVLPYAKTRRNLGRGRASRPRPGASIKAMKESGYVTERHVIGLAEQAGFVLEAKSEINANPKDTKDHPAGVWTLPPTLLHCEEMDAGPDRKRCLNKYGAIGESDRMTLRFRKSVDTPTARAVR